MKILFERDTLLQPLAGAAWAVHPRYQRSILGCALLTATDEGVLHVTATGRGVRVSYRVAARVYQPGVAAIPIGALLPIVQCAASQTVEIVREPGRWIATVRSGGNDDTVACHDETLFPAAHHPSGAPVVMPVNEFSRLVRQAVYAAAPDANRPALSAITFIFEHDQCEAVALDGYRLARSRCRLNEPVTSRQTALVPALALLNALPAVGHAASDLRLRLSRDRLVLDAGHIRLELAALDDPLLPDVRAAIPAASATAAIVDRQALLNALRVSTVTLPPVLATVELAFAFTSAGATLTVSGDHLAGGAAVLDVGGAGDDITLLVPQQFLWQALHALDSQQVEIALNGPQDAVLVRPVGDDGCLAVIMPRDRVR